MWGWVAPSDYSDPNPTHGDILGKGWLQAHRTTANRDAIILSRRSRGMMVNISDPVDVNFGKTFILTEGLIDGDIMNNANWKEVVEWSSTELIPYQAPTVVDWQTVFTLPTIPTWVVQMFINNQKVSIGGFTVVNNIVTYLNTASYTIEADDTIDFYYVE